MRKSDPRTSGVLGTLSRDAVRGGLIINVSDGPQAEAAQLRVDALRKRVKLDHRLDDWTRLTFQDGDTFLELGVSDQYQIDVITRKPTLETFRNSDSTDRFADPFRAFWCGKPSFSGEPPKDAIWFAQWQIVHARWAHDEGDRYGQPLFGSARDAHQRLSEGEFDLAIRRKTRAGVKYVHVLEGATPEQVEEYKARNADAINDPFAAVADFFFNTKGAIDVVSGDPGLGDMNDILHHVRTWAIASPVPLPLLGYGENINRDVLEEQKAQYELALIEVTSWMIGDIVTPIIELEWLLGGIYPESHTFEIAQPTMKPLTAEIVQKVAEAGIKLKALGLPDQLLWPIIARLLPGLDATAVLEALLAVATEPDSVGRVAQEAWRG
jgi:hypothetical protein